MFLPSLPALVGSFLLSRKGRTVIGRHAGKIALAALAWQLWKNRPGAGEDAPAVKAAPSSRRRSRRPAR
ncbi:cysteine protease [Brevundimonas diminuta]|uniref:cysteine protease n=1 Tax=Brevundimonas diminuta TaxID=293 RepID=UPI003CFC754C